MKELKIVAFILGNIASKCHLTPPKSHLNPSGDKSRSTRAHSSKSDSFFYWIQRLFGSRDTRKPYLRRLISCHCILIKLSNHFGCPAFAPKLVPPLLRWRHTTPQLTLSGTTIAGQNRFQNRLEMFSPPPPRLTVGSGTAWVSDQRMATPCRCRNGIVCLCYFNCFPAHQFQFLSTGRRFSWWFPLGGSWGWHNCAL